MVERLRRHDLGPEVLVEDLHYGAVAVAQRIEDLGPEGLVLVGAEARGLAPGTVTRRRVQVPLAGDTQEAVEQAVTGYVSIELALRVAAGLGVLPARTVTIEVEPETTEPSEQLSGTAIRALEEVVHLVELEVRRAPLLILAGRLEPMILDARLEGSPSLQSIKELLAELRLLEEKGRWGRAFMLRDQLVLQISNGETSEGMSHLDWGLWWALIEELARLEKAEAAAL